MSANDNAWLSLKVSLKFLPKFRINPALVQIMTWRRPRDKTLSEPMMVSLLTHICVTRPQWVNWFSLQLCENLTFQFDTHIILKIKIARVLYVKLIAGANLSLTQFWLLQMDICFTPDVSRPNYHTTWKGNNINAWNARLYFHYIETVYNP